MKEKLMKWAKEYPALVSFLVSNLALSGPPLVLFAIMTLTIVVFALIVGIVVGLVGAVLFILAAVGFALVILLPTLFFTTLVAVATWLAGMGLYSLVKYLNNGELPSLGGGGGGDSNSSNKDTDSSNNSSKPASNGDSPPSGERRAPPKKLAPKQKQEDGDHGAHKKSS